MGYACLALVSAIMGAIVALELDIKWENPSRNCLNCRHKTQRDKNLCRICKRAYMDQWESKEEER